tara:strand:+ start:23028 stop:23645 length:618 start_codon:yes stop_codon:yes gene_type:complete
MKRPKTGLLDELAEIHPGYPFRGRLSLADAGNAHVVQFRHILVGEPLNDKHGKFLDCVILPGRKHPTYLRRGDVIFMAKGARNNAVVIGDVPANTVCTPNFYHIRLKEDASNLMPEFLAWQINHGTAQQYFATCSQGSAAPSVTKSQLECLPIIIPPIEKQRQIVGLADAAIRERQLLNQLIENRQRMVNAVGHQLLRSDTTTGK